jgi:hypothetical protein
MDLMIGMIVKEKKVDPGGAVKWGQNVTRPSRVPGVSIEVSTFQL